MFYRSLLLCGALFSAHAVQSAATGGSGTHIRVNEFVESDAQAKSACDAAVREFRPDSSCPSAGRNAAGMRVYSAGWYREDGTRYPFFYYSFHVGGKSCPSNPEQTQGNPVGCLTGTKYQSTPIYQGSGHDALSFSTTYNSQDQISKDSSSSSTPSLGMLGAMRGFSFERKVTGNHVDRWGSEWIVSIQKANGNIQYYYGDNANELKSTTGSRARAKVLADKSVEETLSDGTLHRYNPEGRHVSETKSNGIQRTYHYHESGSSSGKLASITNTFGQTLAFDYNSDGLVSKVTAPGHKDYRFEYDAHKNLIKIIYPDSTDNDLTDNPTKTFLFEDSRFPHGLTGIIDESGVRYATWQYDDKGRATSSVHDGGADRVEFDYSTEHQTKVRQYVSETEYSEKIYRYETSIGGRRVTEIETLPCSGCGQVGKDAYVYDKVGNLKQKIHANGNIEEYRYDSNQREISFTEALGKPEETVTTKVWDDAANKVKSITKGNLETAYIYDAHGKVLTKTLRDIATNQSRITTYTYNSFGQVTSIDGPRTDVNDTAFFRYDSSTGRLTSFDNALGHTVQITDYNADGRPLSIVDSNNQTTTYTWDHRGLPLTQAINGAQANFEYNEVGLIAKVTSPSGDTLSYEYDGARRLTSIADKSGNRVRYTYDVMGNQLSSENQNVSGVVFKKHSQVFNGLGELVTLLGANAQSQQFAYDKAGNQKQHTDGNANTTENLYDALSRLTKVKDALNGETSIQYDNEGRVISVEDAKTLTTTYEYNAFGDVTKRVSPATGMTTYTYDSAGNLLTKTDARNVQVSYTYDALNRLATVQYQGASESVTLHYDDMQDGNYGRGHLTSVIEPSGSTQYVYNTFGQMIKDIRVVNNQSYITEYHFDSNGRATGLTYPSGVKLHYVYNALGQVHEVQVTINGVPQTIASNMSYLPFGPFSSLTYGNGLVQFNGYDLDYRLTQSDVTGLRRLNYNFDNNNQITTINNTEAANQTFSYDELNRLDSASGQYGSLDYGYDSVGNRTQLAENGDNTTYTYGKSTQVPSVDGTMLLKSEGHRAVTFDYDAVGNTIRKNDLFMSFNQANRLSSVAKGSTTASYQYNAKGERSVKILNGVETHYIYNTQGQLIAEGDAHGAIVKEYVYLNNQPYAQIVGSQIYYYHNSHLGAPELMTDNSQNVVWNASYTPFGEAQVTVNTVENNIRFPGQYYDVESGLHYNYFRDYDPSIGRYIESDPIGLGDGVNTYSYTHQNPVNYYDSNGESSISASIGAHPVGRAGVVGYRIGSTANSLYTVANGGVTLGSDIYDWVNGPSDITAPTPSHRAGDEERTGNPATDRANPSVARQLEYERAKGYCDSKPRGDSCSSLSKQIDHAKQCIKFYKQFDAKWNPGRHTEKIETWGLRLANLKGKYKKKCAPKCATQEEEDK
ncbi:RHS repeat-associated core domain-containing protein [Pleionea sp. CnH1-48]|uniref:RHS repeat-associated core domain-containing protein n=1 Tax=Pleionea sp. CnH1-48 TaxID=2954494 RepID=UPI0020982A4A|nr:RHS repeat-associated core domain-containing protein [Pleionea sp. CnH1-48]MCO7225747.1 RHS domain-containing protein [Pleionea sp. CnH1-48]